MSKLTNSNSFISFFENYKQSVTPRSLDIVIDIYRHIFLYMCKYILSWVLQKYNLRTSA